MESQNQTEIQTNWEETVESFDQLDLKADLLRGIYGTLFSSFSSISFSP